MDITWHGYSCFSIKTKKSTIAIDPYGEGLGVKLPQIKADAVLISKDEKVHNNISAIKGDYRKITWPGEYEVSGSAITAIDLCMTNEQEGEENTDECETKEKPGLIYTIDADGLRICFIGDMGKEVSDNLIDNIGDVDILLVPVGGGDTLDAKKAQLVVEKLEPRAVIPMHYKIKGIKDELEDPEDFLKLIGATHEPAEDRLSVKAKTDFPEDKTVVKVLSPQTA